MTLPPRLAARPKPLVIAHRGASDLAPENTALAFRLALGAGADLVETDLWLTADGVPVCHHDASLARMAGDPRRTDQLSWEELRQIEIKRWPEKAIADVGNSASPEVARRASPKGSSTASPDLRVATADLRVPTLESLLEMVPEDVVLLLEIKDPRLAQAQHAEALGRMLGSRIDGQGVVIIGFDASVLKRVQGAVPGLAAGHIDVLRPWPRSDFDLIGVFWPLLLLNPWFVDLAHRHGQLVCPLDPALHSRLARYLKLGVDAVLTNDPAATRERIDRLRADEP